MPAPADTRLSTTAGTGRLLGLCAGYFVSYVLTGIVVKVFTGGIRMPVMSEIAYLVNNTLGGSLLCLAVVIAFRWVRLDSNRWIHWRGRRIPSELVYIVPSGVCTAFIIPTTTLMYLLPISVMVAMVIMRGSIIVISRLVDAIQIRQGLLTRRVYPEEDWAVLFALLAIGTNLLLLPVARFLEAHGVAVARALGGGSRPGAEFEFLRSPAALSIMGVYTVAYAIRIYIMNYFKNTRGAGVRLDNRGYFAYEQIAASVTLIALGGFIVAAPRLLGWSNPHVLEFGGAVRHLDIAAVISGIPYGAVAFFSVFIFMYQGRTATFAGLVNRLTSLLAGTASTVLLFWWFKANPPRAQDWASLAFILIAVAFLARAETRRAGEAVTRAGAPEPAPASPPAPHATAVSR